MYLCHAASWLSCNWAPIIFIYIVSAAVSASSPSKRAFFFFFSCTWISPWYKCTGWLGVKHPLTYFLYMNEWEACHRKLQLTADAVSEWNILQHSVVSKQLSPQEKRRRHKSAIFTRSISEIVPEGVLVGSGGSPHDEMRHTRDDLSLVYDATSGDAAVQTGSSLSSGFDIESLGSMLMSE